jgi:hypothetical protein
MIVPNYYIHLTIGNIYCKAVASKTEYLDSDVVVGNYAINGCENPTSLPTIYSDIPRKLFADPKIKAFI